jgi:hypothetical protein
MRPNNYDDSGAADAAKDAEIGRLREELHEVQSERQREHDLRVKIAGENESLRGLLLRANAVIRWRCFGECRTEGVEDNPSPVDVTRAIDAALAGDAVQPAADQPRACSYTNPCWADDCGACGSRSPTAVQPEPQSPVQP